MPRHALPTATRSRPLLRLVGTWLILVGMATFALGLGLPTWRQHRSDAETTAFLRRVATPQVVPGIPDTASTRAAPTVASPASTGLPPTAAAQPADRAILAPPLPALMSAPTPRAGATVPPIATPIPRMPRPTHLSIPAINVDAAVVEVGVSPTTIAGTPALVWDVPAFAVGHHFSSANPGEGENVVLSGHDDWQGEVFRDLYKLKRGDEVRVRAGDREVRYRVDELLLLPEAGQPLEQREANTRFIGTTGDERLTLVTCWPYGVDDHRLIVIAHPTG